MWIAIGKRNHDVYFFTHKIENWNTIKTEENGNMIVGFIWNVFIKWCHELLVMNSIVAGGLWQGQTHPNRGYSKFKFLYIFKRFVTLKRAEY